MTHANPDSLFAHKRNKTDDVLKALAETGRRARLRHLSQHHRRPLLQLAAELVRDGRARAVDIMGIDHVGIGTDRSHNFTKPDYDWMRMGRWTRGIDYGAASAARPGKAPPPAWFRRCIISACCRTGSSEVGFKPEEVDKITSGNWLRLYREVFAGSTADAGGARSASCRAIRSWRLS